MSKNKAQDDLIKSAQFHPVFDGEGNIVGVKELAVPTDRRLGVRAVEELCETFVPGDERVLASGWTQKQERILKMPAPAAAHYLKPSKKYDATIGEMVASTTIQVPFEVTWRLFETLFEGQYSVVLKSIETETEDVLAVPSAADQKENDNAPGRIFYSRANVAITIHLPNGSSREYAGMGVAYDHVRANKIGNVFAINSSRRTAEKGAISDAKREAVSTIGRVFRRAYEDGDEMIQNFEKLVVDMLKSANEKTKSQRQPVPTPDTAPAPTARRPVVKTKTTETAASEQSPAPQKVPEPTPFETQPEDEIPYDKIEEQEAAKCEAYSLYQEGKIVDQSDDPDIFFDRVADLVASIEDLSSAKRLVEENRSSLKEAEKASKHANSYAALLALVEDALGDGETNDEAAEDADQVPTEDEVSNDSGSQVDWTIKIEKPTGNAIIDGYKQAFSKAKSLRDVDAILEMNKSLARRLTKTQMAKFIDLTIKARAGF